MDLLDCPAQHGACNAKASDAKGWDTIGLTRTSLSIPKLVFEPFHSCCSSQPALVYRGDFGSNKHRYTLSWLRLGLLNGLV